MMPNLPIRILPLLSAILWLTCLTIGLLGLQIPYPRAPGASSDAEIPPTQIISADLPPPAPVPAPQPPPPESSPPAPQLAAPAPIPAQVPPSPAAPAITPVAPPSAVVAFSVPVEGLTRIVDVTEAAHIRPTTTSPAGTGGSAAAGPAPPPKPPPPAIPPTPPPITRLTLGEGEGRQPPPTYPREAVLARQQGTVGVRFTVGEDGHVISAEVISPSYPLLNQEALRTIREKWLFPPGAKRVYEVPIQFQLK